jgi:hypothetical protein
MRELKIGASGLVICVALLLSSHLAAATIAVANANDSGYGSLRDAMASAASGDTINGEHAGERKLLARKGWRRAARLFTFVRFCEQIAQPIEPPLPHGTAVGDPSFEDGKSSRLDAAGAYPSGLLGVHQSAFL